MRFSFGSRFPWPRFVISRSSVRTRLPAPSELSVGEQFTTLEWNRFGPSTLVGRILAKFGKSPPLILAEISHKISMRAVSRNLYQHDNGTYYAIWTVDGKTRKQSLRTGVEKEARAALTRLKWGTATKAFATLPAIVPPEPPKPELALHTQPASAPAPLVLALPSLSDATEEFILHSGYEDDTLRNARLRRRTVLAKCTSWEKFRPMRIWTEYREGGGTPSPANQLRWFLRQFVAYAAEEGRDWVGPLIKKEVLRITLLPVPSRKVKIPPPELVADFLLMCEAHNRYLGGFIRWVALTGLRLSGAKGIRWEEIDLADGSFRRVMKGGKERVIPLLQEAADLLGTLWLEQGKPSSGLVWKIGSDRVKTVRSIMRTYATGFGLDLTYPHALRHHFASVALARGFSAGEVAEMLGHSDGGALVLRVYGHVIRGELRRKVASFSMTGTVLEPVVTKGMENKPNGEMTAAV